MKHVGTEIYIIPCNGTVENSKMFRYLENIMVTHETNSIELLAFA